ncbi:MAG: amidohydrolase family protein [Pseudomonadota bacterium]
MIGKLLHGTAVAALFATSSALAETTAITGATVWSGTSDSPLENAVVIMVDGEISALGDMTLAIPEDATLIEAGGKWITPGIFSPFSQTGLVEVNAEASTNDTVAAEAKYSVALDAADGFNPSATAIAVTRLEGVTRMAVVPSAGKTLFAGQGLIADTSGAANSVNEAQAFQYIVLGEGGAALSGGSRPAAWATLRAALDDARSFTRRYLGSSEGGALNRVDAEALVPAARGRQLMLVQVHRASDIRQLLTFMEEFSDLDIAIVGANEGWLVADELAAAGVPVIIDPFDNLPASFEQLGATSRNAERLIAAGVKTSFAHLGQNSHQARLALQSAGNAVAAGVDPADAIRAITSAPADLFGFDDLGRLEVGATADLVIWDGDPLEVTSAPEAVYINGEAQPMESRQTKLRDRYISLDETDLPLAYRK